MNAIQFKDRLTEAIKLREEGHTEEAREILVELQEQHPESATVNLQCAWVHDKLGLEADAVPFYERALVLGLEANDLRNALLGLGSTYRALGEYENALVTLNRGVETFPEDHGLQVFQAMALYNNGRSKEACELLLRVLIATCEDVDLVAYRDALDLYAADLDRVW